MEKLIRTGKPVPLVKRFHLLVVYVCVDDDRITEIYNVVGKMSNEDTNLLISSF